jgi:LysR family transcriptional regulator (chromosome initiation inhibitor)
MAPTLAQLQALAAVVDHRSFEAAARALHISVGALSQRISALERLQGHPVVTRARPARVAAPAEPLLALARQIDWLVAEHEKATRPAGGAAAPTSVVLAVNADSLSTWFKPMLRWFAGRGVLLQLRIEDQDRTAGLLSRAEVIAAVSTRAEPTPGCQARALGRMRYLPACAPELLPPDGLEPRRLRQWLAATPTLRFDADDALPGAFAAQFGLDPHALPAHLIPSNREYLDAVRAGLGWSVLPEDQVRDDLEAGTLVRLPTRRTVEVALYWHRWRLGSPFLDEVDREVLRCARSLKRPTARG